MENPFNKYGWLDKTLFWLFIYLFILNDYLQDSALSESWFWALIELAINGLLVYAHYQIAISRFFQAGKYLSYAFTTISLLALFIGVLLWSDLGYIILGDISVNNMVMMLFTTLLLLGFSFLYWYYKQWVLKANEALVLKTQKLETELLLLKTQIGPHFLFNTLNNIYSLCQQKHDNAAPMVAKLSNILRYLLYEGSEQRVLLQKELEMLQNYVKLQLLKKSKSQNIDFYTEGIENHHRIAPLLLINFLENSFKHSNFFNDSEAWIKISCVVEEEKTLQFTITNNISVAVPSTGEEGGIGIKNTQRQLELHYSENHQLNIEQQTDSFQVNLSIQLI